MMAFVITSTILLILCLVILFWPLIQPLISSSTHSSTHRLNDLTPRSLPTQAQLNTDIYQEELAKLEHEYHQKIITQADYETSRIELSRRLLAEQSDGVSDPNLPDQTTFSARTSQPIKLTINHVVIGLTIFLILASVSLYGVLGHHTALLSTQMPTQTPMQNQPPLTAIEIEKMVAELAQKLASDPTNLKGWAMLARSYTVLGRPKEAEQAFERAGTYLNQEAELLVEYAKVIAHNAKGVWIGKPTQLIERALSLEPQNLTALWFAGVAADAAKKRVKAIDYWEQLSALLPPDSEDASVVRNALTRLRPKSNP